MDTQSQNNIDNQTNNKENPHDRARIEQFQNYYQEGARSVLEGIKMGFEENSIKSNIWMIVFCIIFVGMGIYFLVAPPDSSEISLKSFYQRTVRPIDIVGWSIILASCIYGAYCLYQYLQGNASIKEKRAIREKIDEEVAIRMKSDASGASVSSSQNENSFYSESPNDRVVSYYESIIESLESEMKAMRRNSSINLIIGIFTSLIGIAVLATAISYSMTHTAVGVSDKNVLFYPFISRVTLSLFVELFSFFFLRLYRKNLDDAKYLTNEITNVKMKMLALVCSYEKDLSDVAIGILKNISNTERNFILKKDESTVENQRIRYDDEAQTKIGNALAALLKK